jgi:hypothetical protein
LVCFKKTFVSHVWHKPFCGSSPRFALRLQGRDQRLKTVMFSKIKRRTAGYQPAMSAKREHLSCGSPHASKGERLKNYAARSAGLKPSCGFVLFSVVSWLREKTVTTKTRERTRNDAEADSAQRRPFRPYCLRASAKKTNTPTRYLGWF